MKHMAIGTGSRSSPSSGSRQDLDLPAEGGKRENIPQNICRSGCVTLQDDQQVTGRGRRAHTQTPSTSPHSSHVQILLESSGKIGQAAQRMVLREQPTGQAFLGRRKEGGRAPLAGSC